MEEGVDNSAWSLAAGPHMTAAGLWSHNCSQGGGMFQATNASVRNRVSTWLKMVAQARQPEAGFS